MKKLVLASLFCVAFACIQGGCSKAKPTLEVCGPPNSIKPDLLRRFEKENSCTVVYNAVTTDSDAMVALKEGGQDVGIVSDQLVPRLEAQGALLKLDRANIPNLANLDPLYLRYAADHSAEVSVPLSVTFLGIGYEEGSLGNDFEASWNALNRAAPGSTVILPDEMRITLGTALRALGFSANSTDVRELSAATAVVKDAVRSGARVESGALARYFQDGSPIVVPISNQDYQRAKKDSPKLRFVVPWEGTMLSFQEAVILADAQSPILAQLFINFLLDPEVAAENSEYALALCPNKAAYRHLSQDMQRDSAMVLPANILAKSESLSPLGDAEPVYVSAWDEIRTVK